MINIEQQYILLYLGPEARMGEKSNQLFHQK